MADMHVLIGNGPNWQIVGHFVVPDTNNLANINYRTAMVNSGLGGTSVLPDGDGTGGTISADEKAAIAAGELYEHVFRVPLEANGDAVQTVRDLLKARYTEMKERIVNEAKAKLKYFGHIESET